MDAWFSKNTTKTVVAKPKPKPKPLQDKNPLQLLDTEASVTRDFKKELKAAISGANRFVQKLTKVKELLGKDGDNAVSALRVKVKSGLREVEISRKRLIADQSKELHDERISKSLDEWDKVSGLAATLLKQCKGFM